MILTVTMNASIDKRYVVSGAKEGAVNRVTSCSYTPGGKGLNVSKPAVIAGADVTATGFVGGHAGAYIVEEIEKLGIKSAFYTLDRESRSCINIWDEEKHLQTEFLEPGFFVTQAEFEAFLTKFETLIRLADVVAMSGSLPKGLGGSAYRHMVKLVKQAGKRVILDTSGALLSEGITANPTMIKPNIDEIRMLTKSSCDTKEELIAAAKQIHDGGVEIVVLSLGAKGSLAVCAEGIYQAEVPKIDALNTVGCGDSMIAAFAIGLEKGQTVPEILRYASAVSAAAALREETGYFRMEDMQRLLPLVRVQRL